MASIVDAAEERRKSTASSENQSSISGRKKQSPINITKEATDHDSTLKATELKFSYTTGDLKTIEVTETGFSCRTGKHCKSVLTAPHLHGTYELWELHAHWGSDKTSGSEHLLEGKAFPTELHFVFWNKKYGEFSKCLNESDGLAVLALFMEEDSTDNMALSPVINGLRESLASASRINMPSTFDPLKLLPEKLNYYTYEGSLTTKPFPECVIWTILRRHTTIGSNQLSILRKLIGKNYRSQQPLNGRRVKSSFKLIVKSATDIQ